MATPEEPPVLHTFEDILDRKYPVGSAARRALDERYRRESRILDISDGVYRVLARIPPRWPTAQDEIFGPTNWRGVGPVVAQFWSDVLDGLLHRFEYRRDADRMTYGNIAYGALDGLAWRFFDDAYVPTLRDARRRRARSKRRSVDE